ncbi:Protein kinase [uncultured virus]|nr:Protein kinase [uncultured virus]
MEHIQLGTLIQFGGDAVYEAQYKGEKCIVKFSNTEREYRPAHLEGVVTSLLEPTGLVPRVLCNLSDIQHVEDDEIFTHALVLEYISGHTLDTLRGISVATSRSLCLEIVEGLAVIYSYGIVHNDLKLDNIMLDGERAKFIDFGCSYDVAYWKLMEEYSIQHEHSDTPEYDAEVSRLERFVQNLDLICTPPICDMEDSISHPDSFSLQQEYRQLVTRCLVPLISLAGDIEGQRRISSLEHTTKLSTILREVTRLANLSS